MPGHRNIMRNLSRARDVSHCSDFKRARLGCVVVNGNKVISVGYNQLKTSPIQKKYNRYRPGDFPDHIHNDTIHAEIDALNKCCFQDVDWKKITVYVGREDKAGHPRMAKPCPACEQALRERGIRGVYYTTDDGYGYLEL